MKRSTGITALMIRRAQINDILPTLQGECEVDLVDGRLRWFVAAKLPRPMHLCDNHYLQIRDALEKALIQILVDLEE